MHLKKSYFSLRRLVLSASVFIHHSRPYFAMSTYTTERSGSGTITVAPRNEASQSGLVVICHGLGDTAEGFVDVAEVRNRIERSMTKLSCWDAPPHVFRPFASPQQLAQKMPHLKFILPTAPTQPVTMNMGMPMPSWYDIVGLDERSNEKCKGLAESRATVEGILQKEHDSTGLPFNRMILAGFSQGGALSLFTGLQFDQAIAGIIVLSGYLPAAKQCQPKHLNIPIWHGHGTMDPLVQFPMAQKTKETVEGLGVESYTLESFPIPHTVSPAELQKMMQFLAKTLPPDDSCKIKLKDPKDMSIKELKAAIRKAGLGSKAVGLMEKSEFIKLVQDYRDGK